MISKRNTFIVTLYVLYVISIIYVNFYIYGVLQIKSDIPHLETGGYAIFGYILFIISIICSCFWLNVFVKTLDCIFTNYSCPKILYTTLHGIHYFSPIALFIYMSIISLLLCGSFLNFKTYYLDQLNHPIIWAIIIMACIVAPTTILTFVIIQITTCIDSTEDVLYKYYNDISDLIKILLIKYKNNTIVYLNKRQIEEQHKLINNFTINLDNVQFSDRYLLIEHIKNFDTNMAHNNTTKSLETLLHL